MSRPTRPVCATHGIEMRCSKTGRLVLFSADFGPYEVWAGDEFECPIDGQRTIISFANQAVARHYEPGFDTYVKRAEITVEA